MNAVVAPNREAVLREQGVIHSALWAAAGDAIGWITELAQEGTVQHRTGQTSVKSPIPWKRTIGGRAGVRVDLPAGTYSDDTQLRLAVSRAIRSNGAFDVEAFARVELTVWQSYSLGAGLGSKAAASNLSKRGVNWFSNFYNVRGQSYFNGGGNGAAMRVQPHSWANNRQDGSLEIDVLRDAIVTHGHPHGFGGAFVHALALQDALQTRAPVSLDGLFRIVDRLIDIPEFVSGDRQLDAFWKPIWEQSSGTTLRQAVTELRSETLQVLDRLTPFVEQGPDAYKQTLDSLGVLHSRYRGSGIRTAIAASLATYQFRMGPPEELLIATANELESDTDTIGTMAGALAGALCDRAPDWPVQDGDYIRAEARRLARIARGERRGGFAYPDLAKWSPPSNQSDAVVRIDDGFGLAGFGPISPVSDAYDSGDFVWQWFSLPFGQTILVKRRAALAPSTSLQQAPANRRSSYGEHQPDLLPLAANRADDQPSQPHRPDWLTFAMDRVLASEFDDRVIGRFVKDSVDRFGADSAVALVGMIARTRLASARK